MTRAALLAWMLAAAMPAIARADSNGWTISGVVVSATTGTPLDRAEVTLSTTGENGTQLAETMTNEAGVFRFDGLQTGKYALAASRRGYLPANYQEHDAYFTAIVTGPGQETRNLRFDLTPYGAISGTVTDDGGSAVAGAKVSLFRQDDAEGELKVRQVNSDMTDDAGQYEFARISGGTYFIAVSAEPWYAFRASPLTNLSNGQEDEPPPSPLDVAYPLTFYPNAPDSSSATAIPMNAGDRVETNFTLHAVPAIHLKLQMPAQPGRRGLSVPTLAQDAFGSDQSVQELNVGNVAYDRSNGSVTVYYGPIAPGHYELQQGNGGTTTLDATSSRTLNGLPAATTVDVRGRFAMASGGALPERAIVWLQSTGGHSPQQNSPVSRDGSFDFSNVAPGTYEVRLTNALVVVQMASSGGDVHGSRITVGNDAVMLAATLASGSATVNGFAARADKGVGGTLVLLVPNDPGASDDLIRRDQSDSDGSFSLPAVVPGTYILVVIENGWSLEWKHRDAIAAYLKHGVTVQVPENQRTVNVTGPVAVQDR